MRRKTLLAGGRGDIMASADPGIGLQLDMNLVIVRQTIDHHSDLSNTPTPTLTELAVEVGCTAEELASALRQLVEHERQKRAEAEAAAAEAIRNVEADEAFRQRLATRPSPPRKRSAALTG